MRAITIVGTGKDARLEMGEVDAPVMGRGEVLIEVAATAVNRADTLQRSGLYPPPPGASEILGLECSGRLAAVGSDVVGWRVGDRVSALLAGGGYAEQVAVDAGSVMPVSDGLDLVVAGGLPEVFLTCYLNLFELAGADEGEWVLVHGGGSGIGTAAIQLLSASGIRTVVTAGSEQKCELCRKLGATVAINYREESFADRVLEITGGAGVDVVLDCIGASYLPDHLRCMATDGRLVVIGLMGGTRAELDLGRMMARRLSIHGSTLRSRSPAVKAKLVAGLRDHFGQAIDHGSIGPVVDSILPLEEAQQAHLRMQSSEHFGKLILRVSR